MKYPQDPTKKYYLRHQETKSELHIERRKTNIHINLHEFYIVTHACNCSYSETEPRRSHIKGQAVKHNDNRSQKINKLKKKLAKI